MNEHDDIHGILVRLLIGGEQALFILLGADGAVSRSGDGSADNAERDLFIGKTGPELFERLRLRVTPELLAWCGRSLSDPNPVGKVCELTVAFRRGGGREPTTAWRYGSESQGPPPEVCQFVAAAVEATNPWFEQQKAMARC